MKSFFSHIVNSAVVFVAEKYGLGTEEDVLKNEIRTLQYNQLLEKAKNNTHTTEEVKRLQEEVKKLTDEKIFLLEKEIQRLEHENKQYKLLGGVQPLQLKENSFSFHRVDRFSFKEAYIKCIYTDGQAHVFPMQENELLHHLLQTYDNLHYQIENNHLIIQYQTYQYYKQKQFQLNEFIRLSEIEDLHRLANENHTQTKIID